MRFSIRSMDPPDACALWKLWFPFHSTLWLYTTDSREYIYIFFFVDSFFVVVVVVATAAAAEFFFPTIFRPFLSQYCHCISSIRTSTTTRTVAHMNT